VQVVRATDSTTRQTNATSYQDSGISITITPQKADSHIYIFFSATTRIASSADTEVSGRIQITDDSDNPLSGAEDVRININGHNATGYRLHEQRPFVMAYDKPATTSATSYKVKHRVGASSNTGFDFRNGDSPSQLLAVEVGA
jgi:hypothetical protein